MKTQIWTSCDGIIGTNGHCNKCGLKSEVTSNRCIRLFGMDRLNENDDLVGMVQEVQMTEEEKVKMYMKLSKKELASMLAHRDMYPPMAPKVVPEAWDGEITVYPPKRYDEDVIRPVLTSENDGCEIKVSDKPTGIKVTVVDDLKGLPAIGGDWIWATDEAGNTVWNPKVAGYDGESVIVSTEVGES